MPFSCSNGRCDTPHWMGKVLLAAGIYHLLFAIWAIIWPCHWFDLIGAEHPNHPLLWRGAGLVAGALGISFLASARNPVKHWQVLGIGLAKFSLGIVAFLLALSERELPPRAIWVMFVNDLIWWGPFAIMLWAGIRAYCGVPPTRAVPYSVTEAARSYKISEGATLEQASKDQLIALVFLRHFGCTFTRQLLRGLEGIQQQADEHGAKLVFVHMLQSGGEDRYLGTPGSISRIADPRCELYRAFGLGKGGFLELFGPRVWWHGAISIFRGCGVGHLAGDGLQMPGAFLFRDGKIISSQPAKSASDLPDLPALFDTLSPAPPANIIPA